MLSCCIRVQQICPREVTMIFGDAERAAYQISEGLICMLLQTSHDRNIKTSDYPQHSCTVRNPCFLWIIKNRHITLQGWKSGGMLQMLLSKTVTSGVCFSSFFFIRKDFFFFTACICLDRVVVCVCVFQGTMGVKGRVSGLVWRGLLGWLDGWVVTGWLFGWSPASSNQARHLSLSLPPPGVAGWDIKTGILINCATLPPAALNMLRPRQAVCYISDSLVLFQLDLAHLSLTHFYHSFPFFVSSPISKSPSLEAFRSPQPLISIPCACLRSLTLINEDSNQ